GALHAVRQLEEEKMGGCATGPAQASWLQPPAGGPANPPGKAPEFASDDGSLLDVMVAYTPEAAAASADIQADAQLAIDITNQSYINSGISERMRLVFTTPVTTGDSGNSTTDLLRMQAPADGFNDE